MPQQRHDITASRAGADHVPARLRSLGYRLMQLCDEHETDLYTYIVPPLVTIPAGPFLMGSDKHKDPRAYDDEVPQHLVTTGEYRIALCPLTVAEYACFVRATGHEPPDDEEERPWEMKLAQCADHPVEDIVWEDLLAYARWLAQSTGETWRIPSEAEWEKAARGTDGRIYPWGNAWEMTRANTDDGGLGETTPVGNYPQGASPYGVLDMVGNVWEWTSSLYQSYPYRGDDGREVLTATGHRTLRGGAVDDYPEDARTAKRIEDYCGYMGGRLAWSVTIDRRYGS
jgi:formylglycine-generating enzyme required for sulfatase activity